METSAFYSKLLGGAFKPQTATGVSASKERVSESEICANAPA